MSDRQQWMGAAIVFTILAIGSFFFTVSYVGITWAVLAVVSFVLASRASGDGPESG